MIFIDEIDAIGSRGGKQGAGGVNQEENRTINQMLAELDGLASTEPVVVFAATNFQDNLDKALLREGRFDRKIDIPMPDLEARKELFTHYLNNVITGDAKGKLFQRKEVKEGEAPSNEPVEDTKVEADPNVSNEKMAAELATLTPSLSPATIATIINEAALAAAVAGDKLVGMKHLRPAIDDVVVGKKQRSRMTSDAATRVALHESGHALVAWLLPQQSKVIKLSITPRGHAAGFTQQIGREVLDSTTDRMLFTDMCVMLGGRTAELTQYDNLTTGAMDDLQRATKHAMNQFLAFGMSHKVGMLSFDYQRMDAGRMYQLNSENIQYQAEREASLLVDAAYQTTKMLLEQNKEKLIELTQKLVEKKELVEEEIIKILGPRKDDATAPLPPIAEQALQRYLDASNKAAQRPDHFEPIAPPMSTRTSAARPQHAA